MPEIDLSDTVGLGLIISWNTGVVYSNQTGGTSCLRPSYEGVYVAVRNDYAIDQNRFLSPEIELSDHFVNSYGGMGAVGGINYKDVEFVNSVLSKNLLNIEVDTTLLQESHEAWVNVLILNNNELFTGFTPFPRKAVLTWCNSD